MQFTPKQELALDCIAKAVLAEMSKQFGQAAYMRLFADHVVGNIDYKTFTQAVRVIK